MARKVAAAKAVLTPKGFAPKGLVPNPEDDGEGSVLLNEVAGVIAGAAAVFVAISFLSFEPGQMQRNFGGPVGYGLSKQLMQTFGLAVYLLPILLGVLGVHLFRFGLSAVSLSRAGASAVLVLSVSILFGLLFVDAPIHRAGGWFGGFFGTIMYAGCGVLGAYVITGALLVLTLMFSTGGSLRTGAARVAGGARQARERWQAHRAEVENARAQNVEPLRVEDMVPLRIVANRKREPQADGGGPIIVLGEEAALDSGRKKKRQPTQAALPFGSGYTPPPLSLLDTPLHGVTQIDEEALRKSSEVLEAKLANFGIEGRVVAVRPGPVITTFEIEPAPGVKVNRIVTLQDDLAMAMRALGVRILAPVPGKAVVGIEVANAKREKVYLKEILESEAYANIASNLTLALGKDSAGNPVAADLMRMPHLLIAGATGTGKSVSLNAMIMSILGKAAPHDVRFVMIDLKMLELSLYEELPHLLVPVVTDAKTAVIVLKNLVEEMDQRYRLLKDKGVRSIDAYNKLLEEEPDNGVIELNDVVDAEEAAPGGASGASPAPLGHTHMAKIVVIIDELADLMMTVGRHAEEPITRLAQKARACGIHLILATQRPSVDVITGLIKANFPARISFQVTARVDSRTILDAIGAERLLGGGDMLYLPPGTARVQRLHGAFVSESEIREVTRFCKNQATPLYAMELLEGKDDESEESGDGEEYDDVMYDQAVRLVTQSRNASISWVQRKLRVGYNRAARMVERMEHEGVVSRSDNGRPREVLAQAIEDDE